MSVSANGFDPENIERIYRGEPALIYGIPPEELLSSEQYQAAGLMACGFSLKQAALEFGSKESIFSRCNYSAYQLLGISSRDGLAPFFPLDHNAPILEGKQISDINNGSLEVMEGLSTGRNREQIAKDLFLKKETIDIRAHRAARETWPDCAAVVVAVRTANALRSIYAEKLEAKGMSLEKRLDKLAFDSLVQYEPKIREICGL